MVDDVLGIFIGILRKTATDDNNDIKSATLVGIEKGILIEFLLVWDEKEKEKGNNLINEIFLV